MINCDAASIDRVFKAQQKLIALKNELGDRVKDNKPVGLLGYIVSVWFNGPVENGTLTEAEEDDHVKKVDQLQKLQR